MRVHPWIAGLVCAALAGAAPLPRVERSAREIVAACTASTVTASTRELVALGSPAARELTRDYVLATTRWDHAQSSAVLQALRERIADARAELLALAAREQPFEVLERAFELLATIGAPRDLTTAVALASTTSTPADEPARDDGRTPHDLLRACAVRLIAQLDAHRGEFERALDACPVALAPALLDALGDAGRAHDLDLLAELLRSGAWREAHLLNALARCARRLDAPFEERVCATVRDELRTLDVTRLREAALCSGWLEDAAAADALVDLIEHDDRGLRANARWALQRITGRNLGARAEVWSRWLAEQNDWWSRRAAELLADIHAGDRVARFRALNEVARRRYPRHELARELSHALTADDEGALRLACAALVSLRSKAAVPALRALAREAHGDASASIAAALDALEQPRLPRATPAD